MTGLVLFLQHLQQGRGDKEQEMKQRHGGGSSFGAGHKCPKEAGAARCPDVTHTTPFVARSLILSLILQVTESESHDIVFLRNAGKTGSHASAL